MTLPESRQSDRHTYRRAFAVVELVKTSRRCNATASSTGRGEFVGATVELRPGGGSWPLDPSGQAAFLLRQSGFFSTHLMLLLSVIPFPLVLAVDCAAPPGPRWATFRSGVRWCWRTSLSRSCVGRHRLSSAGHHSTAGQWRSLVMVIIVCSSRRGLRSPSGRRARSRYGSRFGLMDRVRRLSGEDRFWIAILVAIFGLLVASGFFYRPCFRRLAGIPPPPRRTLDPEPHGGSIRHRTISSRWISHPSPSTPGAPAPAVGKRPIDACMELLAALVSIVGVSELARLLGASRSTEIAASVICATIPSGILLATSTDNDYLAAATGIGVLIILTAFSFEGRWGYRAVALGAAIGLGTWPNPPCQPCWDRPWWPCSQWPCTGRCGRGEDENTLENGIAQVAVIAASTIAIVGVFLSSTDEVFGTWSADNEGPDQLTNHQRRGLGANVTASTAANFGIGDGVAGLQPTSARWRWPTAAYLFGLRCLHQQPPLRWHPARRTFEVSHYTLDQRIAAYGANPWNVLLAVSSHVVLFVVAGRGRRVASVAGACASLGCGFLLLTGIGKWKPYDVRFQLPLFVATSAVIAVALSMFPRLVTRLVLVGLVISCLPELFNNAEQPLVPPYLYHRVLLGGLFRAVQPATRSLTSTRLSDRHDDVGPIDVHTRSNRQLGRFRVPAVGRPAARALRGCPQRLQCRQRHAKVGAHPTDHARRSPSRASNRSLRTTGRSMCSRATWPFPSTCKAPTIQTAIRRFQSTVRGERCCRMVVGAGRHGTFPFWSPVDHSTCSAFLRSRSNVAPLGAHSSSINRSPLRGQRTVGTHDNGDHTIEADSIFARVVTRIDIDVEPNGVAHRRLLTLERRDLTATRS